MVLSRFSTLKPGAGFAGALAGEDVCAKLEQANRTTVRRSFAKRMRTSVGGMANSATGYDGYPARTLAQNASLDKGGQMAGQIKRDKRRIITVQNPATLPGWWRS